MNGNQTKSQIVPSPFLIKLLTTWNIKVNNDINTFTELRDLMISHLEFRPYNDETREDENNIRWRRTGSEILESGYVYEGKSCTDLVIAYMTILKGLGVDKIIFLKVRNTNTGRTHSLCEFEFDSDWYLFDVADLNSKPVKSQMEEGIAFGEYPHGPYLLWKKGRDAWDLGLTEMEKSTNIIIGDKRVN